MLTKANTTTTTSTNSTAMTTTTTTTTPTPGCLVELGIVYFGYNFSGKSDLAVTTSLQVIYGGIQSEIEIKAQMPVIVEGDKKVDLD